jgi:multicomponent K+:H+ antiporter subunit A
LQYLANGLGWARQRRNFNLGLVIGLGLFCATLTGLVSWLFGYPFLTSTFTYVEWPLVGKFELASALAFDSGVFLTVVGIVLLILRSLGQLGQPTASTPAGKEPPPWKA